MTTTELTQDELVYRLYQAQQLVAAIVEIFGTQTPVGKVLDVPFADLERVSKDPRVLTDNLTDREVVRLRRG